MQRNNTGRYSIMKVARFVLKIVALSLAAAAAVCAGLLEQAYAVFEYTSAAEQ